MTRSLLAVAVVALTACPNPIPSPDGGSDSGTINPLPMDACSGKCGVNQKCDTMNRVCVDGCSGRCDGGTICQRQAGDMFDCTAIVTSCKGMTCSQAGQVACLGGECTCLGPSRGVFDSCFGPEMLPGQGGVCGPNGDCVAPKRYQQCKFGSDPAFACGAGSTCSPVFGDLNENDVCDPGDTCMCLQACMQHSACQRGELCAGGFLGTLGCLPAGLFRGQECAIQVDGGTLPDGGPAGLVSQTVTAASLCLRKDTGGAFTETVPTGTCAYQFGYFANQGPIVFNNCRPPGVVAENGLCDAESFAITDMALQCNTGLECAGMRGGATGHDGICLRACNSIAPSVTYPTPYPACNMGESCVNLYRREDINREGALMGVCTKSCNIFDPARSSCPAYGTVPAVCIPTNADGRVVVSNDGSGVCVPQRTSVAALGMPCTESDPFKGASCGAGQVCPPAGADAAPVCTQVCDVSCRPSADAGVPARCATQMYANCPSGKTCRAVTTTTGSRVGFCQ